MNSILRQSATKYRELILLVLFLLPYSLLAATPSLPSVNDSCNKNEEDNLPRLEYVMELRVKIGEAVNVGHTGSGTRIVIPILGGTFSGPGIEGTVLNGGADYQLYDEAHGCNHLEAIYCIQTTDGEYIKVSNQGIAKDPYFVTSPKFEASYEGKYSWLNDAIFICKPSGFEEGTIKLKVWKVE